MMQIVELHFRRTPTCDYAGVKSRAEEILQSELGCASTANKAVSMFHKGHPVKYKEGEVPAQTAILAADEPANFEGYREAIQQSWLCPNAEELLRACKEMRLVTEMMARFLSPGDRVLLFHVVLRAMIEVAELDALVFKHSQSPLEPKRQVLDLNPGKPHAAGNRVRPGSIDRV